ncbi:MAG: sigma-54-dependent Fis family transcriptional regulator [Deltaproteobacteria bacterium]|nr:sigma-54-dependent Fis family transcriptional regulator [Deltaproteobacteria bacterium]
MKDLRILIVEDEKFQRDMLIGFLKKEGYKVKGAESGFEAIELIKKEQFDIVLLDYKMPKKTGIETLEEIKGINPEISVIMMTAYGSVETAIESMKKGALDYLNKPIELEELLLLLERISEKITLKRENEILRKELNERLKFDTIIYKSSIMEEVINLAGRVAKSESTVLIRGESGTGKELIAEAIHYTSRRSDAPLIKVNCSALPETLLESELFGHEKGAFTGAYTRRIGRFEQADGGTIFLDEIGDIPPHIQVKLLRVLQDHEFERVGSSQTIKSDVRVLAATNRDLELAIEEKSFREDLYYRLNVITITIPPLRERKEDITPLVEHFLKKYSEKNDKNIKGVTREVMDLLMKYSFPGNVRELENIIEHAVVISRGEIISLTDLPFHIRSHEKEKKADESTLTESPLKERLEKIEKKAIIEALEKSHGVQTKAAEILGISERVLRYKIRKYNIH